MRLLNECLSLSNHIVEKWHWCSNLCKL